MDRREALSRVALLLGGTIIGSNIFLQTGCRSTSAAELFDADKIALLDEVAETILPQTKTPGAKAAKVGAFMAVMVKDCYTPAEQQVFIEGIKKLNDASEKLNGKKFMDCNAAQRTKLLQQVDQENREFTDVEKLRVEQHRHDFIPKSNLYEESNQFNESKHYFRMMKELTLLGFFSSETGATHALRYVPIPGKYDGNYSYKKGDRAWALT